MKIIKPIPTIIIGLLFFIEFPFSSETALIFTPFFSSTYYSSGSVFQPEKDGKTIITNFQLGAKKNTGPWSISGRFQFIQQQILIQILHFLILILILNTVVDITGQTIHGLNPPPLLSITAIVKNSQFSLVKIEFNGALEDQI